MEILSLRSIISILLIIIRDGLKIAYWVPPGNSIGSLLLLQVYCISERLLLDLYCKSSGTLLDLYWNSTGTMLDLYWASTGPLVGLYETSTEPLLQLYWATTGSLLELYWNSMVFPARHYASAFNHLSDLIVLLGNV